MNNLVFRPLTADEIECRVAQVGKTQRGAWCSLLLYKDARCDQRMLDETVGCFNWQRAHALINDNLFCTVSIRTDDGEWVSKQDVGTESNTEAVKGEASDSFKRACFNWGIGRELYTAPKIFINLREDEVQDTSGKPKVSQRTVFRVASIAYDDKRNINSLSIVDGNGEVRYQYPATAKNTTKATAKPQTTAPTKPQFPVGAYTADTLQEAISGIDTINTPDALKQYCNDNRAFWGEQAFTDAAKLRRKEIKEMFNL